MLSLSRWGLGLRSIFTAFVVAIIALLPYSQNGSAQTDPVTVGIISGRVTDSHSSPLANIPVNLDGPNIGQSTCTDGSGNYTFGGVQLGIAWRVEAMRIGDANWCGGSNASASRP